IGTWVRQGMPEGPADALPPVPKFDSDWHLGPPDLVVEMKDGFDVPASGRDIYRNFVVPVGAAEDHWIAAIDLRPSARAVLHHVLVFLDDSGEAQQLDGKDGRPGFAGMVLRRAQPIGGWAAGGRAEQLPDGLGIKLPKGNDLVLQSHFHPSGKKATEKTVIGLYFTKVPPVRTIVPIQLPPFFGVAAGIDIKPGDKNWLLQDSFTLPCAVEAVTVGGHAHMLGKTMRLVAKLPDGRQEPLLLIRNWDFDWQNRYTYQGFPRLPTGSVLHAEITYDNSSDNPNNPNRPPKEVRWGRESTDEMGSITLMVVAGDEQELATLQAALRAKIVSSAGKGAESVLEQRFRQMDKNGDGKVTRDEVPARMRRMFEMLDKNGDGALDMDEIKGLLGNLGGIGDDPAPSKPKGKSGDGKGNDGK
ncbi:MAG TPA: hypothetical protein VK348_05955, partial [Planctomycetota bacterium]|nr:hypothetical protein [Planctomycetota bacterium]